EEGFEDKRRVSKPSFPEATLTSGALFAFTLILELSQEQGVNNKGMTGQGKQCGKKGWVKEGVSGETDFGPQIENLNKKLFTVVAWDPRGYGHSRPPDRDFPVEFFERDAKDAVDLMKMLKFKKVSLLGWSDGGITALIAAARYPSCINKMVIWGANAYVTDQDEEIYQGIRDVSKWSERTRKPLEALYGFDYFARTCEKWCPALIAHGPEPPCRLHTQTRDGSRLHLMPEGKHNLHLRFADEFNKLVEDFLQ
ncbi:hypothetical protein E2I00_014429, partial [Balaenoptera physalus]